MTDLVYSKDNLRVSHISRTRHKQHSLSDVSPGNSGMCAKQNGIEDNRRFKKEQVLTSQPKGLWNYWLTRHHRPRRRSAQ